VAIVFLLPLARKTIATLLFPLEGQYPVVVPFTEEETGAMLKAAERLTINDKNKRR
jgi:hypothetical protein